MNTYQYNRLQKLAALQQAMQGNAEPLRQLQQQQGRPYTEAEIEQRRLFLGKLLNREATRQETLRVLGRYDKSGIPGKVCIEYAEGIYVWHN